MESGVKEGGCGFSKEISTSLYGKVAPPAE